MRKAVTDIFGRVRLNRGNMEVADGLPMVCQDCGCMIDKRYLKQHVCFAVRWGDGKSPDERDE